MKNDHHPPPYSGEDITQNFLQQYGAFLDAKVYKPTQYLYANLQATLNTYLISNFPTKMFSGDQCRFETSNWKIALQASHKETELHPTGKLVGKIRVVKAEIMSLSKNLNILVF